MRKGIRVAAGKSIARGRSLDFNLLYHKYSGFMFKVIAKRFRDHATAEDIYQQTWIKVFALLASYNSTKASISTWLCQIAISTAEDLRRSAGFKRAADALNIEEPGLMDNLSNPNHFCYDAIGLETLLTVLKPDEHLIVRMYYLKDYTQKEIAEELGLPLSTVKTIIRRSIEKLKSCWCNEIGYYRGTLTCAADPADAADTADEIR